jgi:cbb3-type cytochrome oxidase maturation protein
MNIVIVLIAASLTIAIGFLIAFIWAVKSGQFEDRFTPSVRILFDDIDKKTPSDNKKDPVRERKNGR